MEDARTRALITLRDQLPTGRSPRPFSNVAGWYRSNSRCRLPPSADYPVGGGKVAAARHTTGGRQGGEQPSIVTVVYDA